MLTAGVDLAAEPAGTALAVIDWTDGKANLIDLQLGMDDQQIIDATSDVSKVGIDCALGWPAEFVSFLAAYSQSGDAASSSAFEGDIAWRRRLAYRQTDRHVRQVTGRWPLSVSTDRLGMTALRCAGLLSKFHRQGVPVDRTGAGMVVEVYPAGTLRIWGFEFRGYRQSEQTRRSLIARIRAEASWLELGEFESLMIESCDALDSVIAAMAARSVALGWYQRPSQQELPLATTEGWVALPTGALSELAKDG